MPDGIAIAGRVQLPDGAPASGALVACHLQPPGVSLRGDVAIGPGAIAFTANADGIFTGALVAGHYTLVIHWGGRSWPLLAEVPGAAFAAPPALQASALVARWRDASGTPNTARLAFIQRGPRVVAGVIVLPVPVTADAGSDGQLAVELIPGTYMMKGHAQGVPLLERPITAPGDWLAEGTLAGPVNTVAPVVTGSQFVGETLTRTLGTWEGTGTIGYATQWLRGGTAIGGATGATYQQQAADAGQLITARVTATDDEGSRSAVSNAVATEYPQPVAAGELADVEVEQDSGDWTRAAAGDFTGIGLSYSLQAGPSGTSVNPTTGLVTGSSAALLSAASVVVRASTPDGKHADSGFSVTVAAVDPGDVAPEVSVALAEEEYFDGATIDASDIEPVIDVAGSPALTLGDLTLTLLVDDEPVSLPHEAAEGEVLVGRATWSHPTGAGQADSDPVTVQAAGIQSDPNIETVREDGWSVDYRILEAAAAVPGSFGGRISLNSSTDDNPLIVLSPGYDENGDPTTVTRMARCSTEVRQPYDETTNPSGGVLSRVADGDDAISRVALSEFIHAGDTIVGVTNNSEKPYFPPQCVWMQGDNTIVTDSFTARCVVAHHYARKGRPVAGVRFILRDPDDNSIVAQQLVTSMSFKSYSATGLGAPCFEHTFDFTSLTNRKAYLLDAEILPWVGEAFLLSADGRPQDQMLCTVQTVWKLTDPIYAYLDPATGNNSTAVISSDPAVAAANPFATALGMINATTGVQNSTTGHGGTGGGAIMRFVGECIMTSNTNATYNNLIPDVWESADPETPAVIQDAGNIVTGSITARRLIVRDITLRRSPGSGNLIRQPNNANLTNLVCENVFFDPNGQSSYQTWINFIRRCWLINCTGTGAGTFSIASTNAKNVVRIGSSTGGNGVITHVASTSGSLSGPTGGRIFDCSGGGTFFCRVGTLSIGDHPTGGSLLGIALVGVSALNTGTGAALWISADNDGATMLNVNVQMITSVGFSDEHRFNFLYNDFGSSSAEKWGSFVGVIVSRWSGKTDMFANPSSGRNGARVGNWPRVFMVGWRDAQMVENISVVPNGSLGPESWRREVNGRRVTFQNSVFDPGWDAERRPTNTDIPRLEAGLAPYPFDYLGQAVPDDGTAPIGALMFAA